MRSTECMYVTVLVLLRPEIEAHCLIRAAAGWKSWGLRFFFVLYLHTYRHQNHVDLCSRFLKRSLYAGVEEEKGIKSSLKRNVHEHLV